MPPCCPGWDNEDMTRRRFFGRLGREASVAPRERRDGVHYVGYPGQRLVLIESDEAITGVLRHHVKHSPTGFAWGYTGSGPADLARCILVDVLGGAATCEQCSRCEPIEWESALAPSQVPSAPAVELISVPVKPCSRCERTISPVAEANYQRFKEEVVAEPGDSEALWSVSQDRVRAWLRDRATRLDVS